ncbi:MAG TPA: hypothetical protein VFP12_11160 [Allosphingosinicella sp.]|nr:hypothetical protein [Allosphingosinicella sp.]
MRDFNLSHAVSTYSTYVASMNSLWGLYIVATFAAAGFGASMKEQFNAWTALLMTISFLAFAAAHLSGLMANLRVQKAISAEVMERLGGASEETDFPATVGAVVGRTGHRGLSLAVHLVIDACVVAIIWSSVSKGV